MPSSVWQGFDEYQDSSDDSSSNSPNSPNSPNRRLFTPKYQRSTKNNPLCGICLKQWIQILKQQHRHIEWTVYWPRLLLITFLACVNSLLSIPEYLIYEKRIQAIDLLLHTQTTTPPPVFILGHPRTGTTLLHSLLALDEEQFGVCTTFCAGFPSCFLWFERIGKILFQNIIDDTRPMDNVKLHFDLPQEDELATNVLSAGKSPYMPLFFMQQEPSFRPYYAFGNNIGDDAIDPSTGNKETTSNDECLPPDIMAADRKQWTTSFLYLVKKLSLRLLLLRQEKGEGGGPNRRLLLKSPVHTARIKLLLQLFPDAQFIYIHRHPYDVFRSALHMADTTYWYTYLNTPSQEQILEFILRQYEILWDRYEEGRAELLLLSQNNNDHDNDDNDPHHKNHHQKKKKNHDNLIEVSFEELTSAPQESIQRIYETLGWKLSPQYKQRLETELESVHSYQRNVHKPLPPYLQRIVQERWGPSFDRLGYQK